MFHGNEEVERGTRGIGANKQHAPKELEVVRRIVLAASSSGVSVQKAKTAHYLPTAWVSILHVPQTSWRRQSSRRGGMWSVSGHFIGGYNEVNSGGDRKTPYSSALCRLATINQRSRSIVNCRPRDYSFYHVQSPPLPQLCSLYILKLSDKRQFPTRTREVGNHSRQATNYHGLSIKLTPVDPLTNSAMCTSNLLASNLHVPFRTMAS
jgi:hypothetical protein